MPEKITWTEIEGRKLKLTNLDKILYPDLNVSKAEVIQYYLQIAPIMLRYVRNRPMSFVRYPDGVDGKSFYSKDKPDWAPKWIKSILLGEESAKDYILIDSTASLVWLANLACLEMHQMQMVSTNIEHPDHMVFDLDPTEDEDFAIVREICQQLKTHLEGYGYRSFLKTSGGKGLHIFVPIHGEHTHEEMVLVSKEIAGDFVKKFPDTCTLQLPKNKRNKKVLIDIYRNHNHSTIVSPYSLRGKPGGPVSMPLAWDDLADVESPQSFTIKNAFDQVEKFGDPWIDYFTSEVQLHTKRMQPEVVEVPDDSLKEYFEKRDFSLTPEPAAILASQGSNRFVIHRHLASHLHYDLRLEKDGTLKCWAMPKGLPFRKGEKRLAVQTEDHPVNYLTFRGTIPKGQYGGGEMDIYDSGQFEMLSEKKGSIRFQLIGKTQSGEFALYKTKDDQYIIERKDAPIIPILTQTPKHMLAGQAKDLPKDDNWQYEVKWDGIRSFLIIDDKTIRILSRSQRDITYSFPEIVLSRSHLNCNKAIIDGEIVCLDEIGRPVFSDVISRMHTKGEKKIQALSRKLPAYFYAFDLVFLDGKQISRKPLELRQKWLKQLITDLSVIRPTEALLDGKGLYEASKNLGLEGVMAKRKGSRYQFDARSDDWLKIKFRSVAKCVILGFTEGQGNRKKHFGSLQLGEIVDGELVYRGRVGTGFNDRLLAQIYKILLKIPTSKKPFDQNIEEERATTWIEGTLRCEIEYASVTSNNTFREPVYKRLFDQ